MVGTSKDHTALLHFRNRQKPLKQTHAKKKKMGKDQTDTWPKKDLHIVKSIQNLYKNIIC